MGLVEGGEGQDEDEVSQMLSDDFARAEFIRDRLVPKAVLFFTGEIMDEEEDVRRLCYMCGLTGGFLYCFSLTWKKEKKRRRMKMRMKRETSRIK